MGRMAPFLFLALVFIVLDWYTYSSIRQVVCIGKWSRIFPWVYGMISILGYYSLAHLMMSQNQGPFGSRTLMLNLMIGFVFTLFVSKLTFTALMGVHDIGRYLVGIFNFTRSRVVDDYQPDQFVPNRRSFLTQAATVIAGIPLLTMLYGFTRGKYNYTVEKVVLTFKDLPKSFDGFKLIQISDIHAGSFDSQENVKVGIDMINELEADIVCFTGDLVNSEKEEIDPYIDIFANIKAKQGKFAIYGNHDYYGTYDRDSQQAKDTYFDDFEKKYKKMGFDLIKNENRTISRGDESIKLVGVENWGAGRWFPKKGDLDEATLGMTKDGFNILMSHDPTHWDEKVLDHDTHMHLTLSGHTHGFQFGFQMAGFKWSPAQYRYPRWLGLYQVAEKYLYVNRGFGFLGFPGRVGMWPEITLIELRSA